ncbi:hypothetical protein P6F26_07790 [Roseibacterium sp. SDUM158017]|uniref:hypothetical protein n=1 Tax=Roseicyclus salinarum TaxID=3036773 RepID=UPI0024158FA3|nr:hypothetical protein [Roseibacterium sp. SDUM158017]MDG4648344.1 hypothetical protein [Roseibacterium sp. SDUM158017]
MSGPGQDARPVRRRIVLYVPGYDPVPPRKYRERYRREAARQAGFSGHEIALSPPCGDARFGWRVSARIEGAATQTEVEVLHWADIVRSSMGGGIAATYGQLLRTAWIYLRSGTLFRLARLRKGPVIAALFPLAVLLLQLLAAAGVFLGVAAGTAAVLPAGYGLLGLVPASGAGYGLVRWFRRRDHLLAWYLMHDYAFSARHDGAYPAAQEARMAEFAERIAGALGGEADEVLVVGHSSGAYLAVSVIADLIRAGRVPCDGPALGLLTLGQVIPMVSFLPGARRLRADLALLSASARLTWIDVSAPGDGCTFALCDPVAVSGVAPPDKRWPLVISAAFSRTLSADAQSALRWRFLERHFQYLNAFDNLSGDPGEYDYFAITAGPRTLSDRFAARRPSKSRIERALSRHTDRAA